MENLGSERRRRLKRRKALSDITNILSLSTTDLSTLKRKPKPTSKSSDPNPSPSSTVGEISITNPSTTDSNGQKSPGDPSNPTSTPKAKEISENAGEDAPNHDKNENSIIYTRRTSAGRKPKGKAVVVASASSCPPVGRTQSKKGKIKMKDDSDMRKTFSVPYIKDKKRQHHTVPKVQKPILPQDFVEKQRAYFAEIDAYELPEEEVSESELE